MKRYMKMKPSIKEREKIQKRVVVETMFFWVDKRIK